MNTRRPAPNHEAMSGLKRLAHPIAHNYRTASLVQREVGTADATPAEKAPKPSAAQALFPNLK
jgi:hypothetical protein